MEYRTLGSSDLHVSEISLGSWLTYSGGVSRERTEACTRAAFEAGINFFDTANVYGRGAAEQAWGEILSGYPRNSYVLATKLFWPMADEHAGRPLGSRGARPLDASLRAAAHRLRRPLSVPPLRRRDADRGDHGGAERGGARRQGALIGFSEWTPEQIRAALEVAGTREASSPPSRSTTCCGAARSARSSSSAPRTGSARSSGRRWLRAY